MSLLWISLQDKRCLYCNAFLLVVLLALLIALYASLLSFCCHIVSLFISHFLGAVQAVEGATSAMLSQEWRFGGRRDVYADFNGLTLAVTVDALFGSAVDRVQSQQVSSALLQSIPKAFDLVQFPSYVVSTRALRRHTLCTCEQSELPLVVSRHPVPFSSCIPCTSM